MIGQRVEQVLGLSFHNGDDPVADRAGVGGARAGGAGRGEPANATCRRRAKADMFPAYDDDGGLLLVLTPEK